MGNTQSEKNYFIGTTKNAGNILDTNNGKTVDEIREILKDQGIKTIDVVCAKDGVCTSETMPNGQYIICNKKYLPELFNSITLVEVC